ncbi:MAG: hypothetical protein JWO20_3336 [Candidatus Angelobacter sp.]|jgi:hypothetical protein|nr:hypothetical protein [Candidatus Angelobacter sp.]
MHKRARSIGFVVLTLLAVAVLVIYSHERTIRFDAVLWRDPGTSDTVKLQVADDLIATQALSGKTRKEVTALLGQPPETNYFKEYDLVYYLGPERGFISIDSEWLVLKFGPDGRASDVGIARD